MNIDSLQEGIVIDHITAGRAMRLYQLLGLDRLESPVAMIMHATSRKLGAKDIIKIDGNIPVNFDVIGLVDPGATVNIIRGGRLCEKRTIGMPEELHNVLHCKNPRCITSTEQELEQVFRLTDRERKIYRCVYCETAAE